MIEIADGSGAWLGLIMMRMVRMPVVHTAAQVALVMMPISSAEVRM